MEQETWGEELRIDLFDCKREKVTQKEYLKEYIKKVVELIDMKPYGECLVERFGEGDINGVSAFSFLMTSSIVVHCREDNGHSDCYINIFSCKDFDPQSAIIFSQGFFEAKKLDFDFKKR
jgi:S-adenosylmethionine/arginine decarboxylase-like enzyme